MSMSWPPGQGAGSGTVFQKGILVTSPSAASYVIWRAPFNCTVTAVKAYQDTGSGSVVTALDGTTDLLVTDITTTAATWVDGGSLAFKAVLAGDSIVAKITSVSGTPNYIVVQVQFTQP